MDVDADPHFAAFLELYGALPREGPGSLGTTLEVLESIGPLGPSPRIIDAGCGSGAATFALASARSDARILAVDVLEPLLDRLRERARALAMGASIEVRGCSMDAIDEPPASVDLIWSEGAIYNVGVERALRSWRPLLRPGGRVVFSQLCWFVGPEQRPRELVDYWARTYPDIVAEAAIVAQIEAAGLRGQPLRRLEMQAWFRDYYDPLLRRCQALSPSADAILAEVIADAQLEIAVFEDHFERYGYTFFLGEQKPLA